MHILSPQPLTKAAFAEFGAVVEAQGASPRLINQGYATRYHRLAMADVGAADAIVSLFCAQVRPKPLRIERMERHPLGSQTFYPLQNEPWLVVVCVDPNDLASFRAFVAQGNQGVHYAKGTWHFPLLVTRDNNWFVVLDREGPGNNLEEVAVMEDVVVGEIQ